MSTPDTRIYWIHALSPLRIGVEEGLDAINLPTMREVHTGHPLVPGSSVKGVLRGEMDDKKEDVNGIFGPDRALAGDYRGGLGITDATLVALPVRSLVGTFAWVCSQVTLRRLQRHRQSAGRHALPEALLGDDAKVARVCTGSALLRDGRIYVEEFEQGAEENAALDKAAQLLAEEIWPGDEGTQRFFRQRLLLTQNSVFDALARNSLELRTRVCIDGTTGTAADSGPWTEEAMPAETLLAGLVVGRATTVVKRGEREELGTERQLSGGEAIGFMSERWGQGGVLRMGGHTSIGFGRAWFRMVE